MVHDKTWVEINKNALLHNIASVKTQLTSGVKVIGVIKANAYGHGLIEVGRSIEKHVDLIAVDSITEAIQLREQGIATKIVILGYTVLDNLHSVIEHGCEQVVTNMESLDKMGEIAQKLNKEGSVHLKIETGTSRQGIWPDDLPVYLKKLQQYPLLRLAGVSTHFANIEDTLDNSFVQEQLRIFTQATQTITNAGYTDFVRHATCSAGALVYPDTHFDAIRLGISLYGLWSSPVTRLSMQTKAPDLMLQPVLSWKTRIAHIKTVPAGSTISYGRTERVEKDTRIAVLPVGYYDGLDRKLSSIGTVLINGKRCKIMGRICMNMCMVDLSAVPEASLEDEVVLLGRQGDQEMSADNMAGIVGTINYEIVTRINPLIPRIVV